MEEWQTLAGSLPLAGHSVSSHEGAVCWTPASDLHGELLGVLLSVGLLGLEVEVNGELEGRGILGIAPESSVGVVSHLKLEIQGFCCLFCL